MRFRWFRTLALASVATVLFSSVAVAAPPEHASVVSPSLTVTASATLTPATPSQAVTVILQVQASAADVKMAMQNFLDKVKAIRAALTGAGIAANDIELENISTDPGALGFGMLPPMYRTTMGVDVGSATVTASDPNADATAPKPAVYLSGTLAVRATDQNQSVSAIQAALTAGATSANTMPAEASPYFRSTIPPISQSALQDAVARATTQAQQLAQAQAKSAGLTLGQILEIHTQPPEPWCLRSPDTGCAIVTVSITYDITNNK